MSKKKVLVTLVLPLFLASFLQSQSLAELAKKEKERRAALKGKGTAVTTNADLAKVKKREAVVSAGQELTAEEEAARAGQAEAQAQQGEAPPAGGEQVAEEAKPVEEIPPGEKPAMSQQEIQKRQNELADDLQKKVELVELLNLKMNALYQEFYGLDNIKSRELIQIQISETYDKLLKAELESATAKKELEDFLAQTKKDAAPAIWIR